VKQALALANAGNRAKSAFLAMMSHELRTPLNAIMGFADLIGSEVRGPVGQPVYKEFASHIHRGGVMLLRLVDDVLEFARIEGGELKAATAPVNAATIAHRLGRQLRAEADAAGVSLTIESAAAVPPARADERLLHEALEKLVSNAIKFTSAGGTATVSVGFDADRNAVSIDVGDTGIGMEEADISTALEPFGQIDSSLSRRYDGAGLGLPLAKRLVEAMGGSLTLRSQGGLGTHVTIDLPAEAAADIA
jgi:two-component system cell cycle sensor histidine kinase PleC